MITLLPLVVSLSVVVNKEQGVGASLVEAIANCGVKWRDVNYIEVFEGFFMHTDFFPENLSMSNAYPMLKQFIIRPECQVEQDSIPDNAFFSHQMLQSFSGPHVLFIGKCAFANCSNLDTIDVTSLHNADIYSFSNTSITQISLNFLTSISACLFQNCQNLQTISFPNVTDIEAGAFDGCTMLETVSLDSLEFFLPSLFAYLPKLRTVFSPRINYISSYTFYECRSLESIFIELDHPVSIDHNAFSFSGLRELNVFLNESNSSLDFVANCSNLVSVEISGLSFLPSDFFQECTAINVVKMTDIKMIETSTFENLSLSECYFPNIQQICERAFKNSSITSVILSNCVILENAFTDCNQLLSINLDNCTLSSNFTNCLSVSSIVVKNIDLSVGIFKSCDSISSLVVINSSKIPREEFMSQSKLESVILENIDVIGDSAFKLCKSLSTLSISNVSVIGDNAFENTAIVSLDSVTAGTIGGFVFSTCQNLQTITITAEQIGKYAFSDCRKLSTVYIWTNSIQSTAFEYCPQISEYHGPIYDPSNMKELTNLEILEININQQIPKDFLNGHSALKEVTFSEAFINDNVLTSCPSLSTVKVNMTNSQFPKKFLFSSFSILSIELECNCTISSTFFSSFSSLASVIFSSYEVGPTFINCPSLSHLTINSMIIKSGALSDLPKLSSLMFDNVEYLESSCMNNCPLIDFISIPSLISFDPQPFVNCNINFLDFPNVKALPDHAFSNVSSLSSVVLHADHTLSNYAFEGTGLTNFTSTSCTTIPEGAFRNCLQLRYVKCPFLKTVGRLAFSGCSNLTEIKAPLFEAGSFAFAHCTSLCSFESEWIKALDEGLFLNCKNLAIVDCLLVNSVGADVFLGCEKLNQVKLNSLETVPASCFSNHTSLTNVSIKHAKVINSYSFFNCSSLATVSHSAKIIHNFAFSQCSSLSSINLDFVEELHDDAFSACQSLVSANLPKLRVIGSFVFCQCTLLENFTAPIESFTNGLFKLCSNLKSIDVKPIKSVESCSLQYVKSVENVDFSNTVSIGEQAFSFSLVNSLSLPNVTQVGKGAFYSCKELISVIIPKVKNLPECLFEGCNRLKDVICMPNTINSRTFAKCISLSFINLSTLQTIYGDEAFSGCFKIEIVLASLKNLPFKSSGLFSHVSSLELHMPNVPPKTFNETVFHNVNVALSFSDESIKEVYDQDVSIKGDEPDDRKWCGIDLYEHPSNTWKIWTSLGTGLVLSIIVIVVIVLIWKRFLKKVEPTSMPIKEQLDPELVSSSYL